MILQGEATQGRYCLPVRQGPPLANHLAYRVAAAHMALANVVCLAANLDVLRTSFAFRHVLEVWVISAFVGMLGTVLWISSVRRRVRIGSH